ncbi:hypothetical protein QTP70_004036 [Hemibagrus guttatus]|uniref:C2H2-type domain-containing protein n=1 Tax=Hemibagrus guttatus TaxID=175788 RepID=A0AAE0URH9_9TELE|nr:hypothetical protein QTP70_004036 [Hemibagrus guttatus]
MSQKPDSLSRVWAAGAPAHDRYPKHIAPDPYAPSCGWWAYGKVGLRRFFGLCPAESRRQRLGHQALTCVPQPQAWLQGGAPVTPVRATTAHARAKSESADQAALAADQESELARSIATELAPDFQQPGLEYIKENFTEHVEEVKDTPPQKETKEEEKESVTGSPFYRRGTTPSHSPAQSPSPSPPLSPTKKNQQASTGVTRKISKESATTTRKISKDNSAMSHKISKDERATIVAEMSKVPTLKVQDTAPPKPPKLNEPSVNGQLHTAYHSYYVKTQKYIPPPEEPEEEEPEMTQSSLARMPPPPKQVLTPTAKLETKLRKQESIKPKSLTETKKASMEITNDALEDDTGLRTQNSVKQLLKVKPEKLQSGDRNAGAGKVTTHIQKMRTGAGNDSDSSTPVMAYPYVSNKPYQCDVCHVSYFYSFGLESHLKSVLHQSRTRKAGNTAANSKTNTETGIMVSNLAGMTVANATQLASAKTCNCVTQAEKVKVQLQPASSLLPAPVVSAQAVPTVLPLLTLAPNSVPHTIVPSVFPPPGTSSTQLIPQTQMLMPLIMNGLQAQSATPDGSQQIVQQAVSVLGICSAQQVQGLSSSDSQSQSAATRVSSASRISLETKRSVDGLGAKVKFEIKEEPCDQEVSQMTPRTADAITQVDLKQENNSMWDGIEDSTECGDKQPSKAIGLSVGINSKRRRSDADQASTTQDLQSSHVTKSRPPRYSSSHTHLASKPSNTKPRSSSFLEPPALTEFQSQVLWAFFESRNEADSEIPPREDCEALGREVGLTEDEIRKWLIDTPRTKVGHRADVQTCYERQGSTEDDEDALMIDESGGTVLRSTTDFLSDEEDADDEQTTVDKKRKRGMD